jgi:hypothetical protein
VGAENLAGDGRTDQPNLDRLCRRKTDATTRAAHPFAVGRSPLERTPWVEGAEVRQLPCPGRGAAFFVPLRRAGTVPDAGARYGPGSAAHRFARATRCAASGARQIYSLSYAGLTRVFILLHKGLQI